VEERLFDYQKLKQKHMTQLSQQRERKISEELQEKPRINKKSDLIARRKSKEEDDFLINEYLLSVKEMKQEVPYLSKFQEI